MQIEIDAPRPLLLLVLSLMMIVGAVWYGNGTPDHVSALQASIVQTSSQSSSSSSEESSAASVLPAQGQMPVAYPLPTAYPYAYPQMMPIPYGYAYQQGMPAAVPGFNPATPMVGQAYPQSFAQPFSSSSTPTADELAAAKQQAYLLGQREAIMRAGLDALEQESKARGSAMSPDEQEQFRQSTRELVSLLQDKQRAEEFILSAYKQEDDAEAGIALMTQSLPVTSKDAIKLAWPVPPLLGISAYFHDTAYFSLFHREHNAVDIPIAQGSIVKAPAEGIVMKVSDNGYGFNSLVIQHPNGLATLYGHVTKFLVKEGDHVTLGQSIALSGGRPGTLGAGVSTTGPHLHFQVYQNGQPIDPLQFLSPVNEFTGAK